MIGYRAQNDAVKALQCGSSKSQAAPYQGSGDPSIRWRRGNFLLPTTAVLYKGEWTGSTALRACQSLYGGSCGPAPLPFPLFPRGSPSPEWRGRGKKGGELPASTLSS